MSGAPVVVVGGGHNGLVAACYLAKAGKAVIVLEAADKAGGGSRTDETIPGYLFNTHAAAHNIINMTSIPWELGLAEAGLESREMDPFAIAVRADGRRGRFHRSVDRRIPRPRRGQGGPARQRRRPHRDLVRCVPGVVPTPSRRTSHGGRSHAANLGLLHAARRPFPRSPTAESDREG